MLSQGVRRIGSGGMAPAVQWLRTPRSLFPAYATVYWRRRGVFLRPVASLHGDGSTGSDGNSSKAQHGFAHAAWRRIGKGLLAAGELNLSLHKLFLL